MVWPRKELLLTPSTSRGFLERTPHAPAWMFAWKGWQILGPGWLIK